MSIQVLLPTPHHLTSIWNLKKVEYVEAESRMVVVRGRGGAECGEMVVRGNKAVVNVG